LLVTTLDIVLFERLSVVQEIEEFLDMKTRMFINFSKKPQLESVHCTSYIDNLLLRLKHKF
jgi:hypothetical protein